MFRHYRIERELGRGGMGVVYKALDTKVGRTIALKLLLSQRIGQTIVRRFYQEALATSQLEHPNIVKLYEVGEEPAYYLTMEYIDGETLAEMIGRKIERKRAAEIIAKVALALEETHRKGIMHRDIKPGNIMVSGDNPKLMDFGLVKFTNVKNRLTKTGEIMGTPQYMSPEQAAGKRNIDFRSDIYSLGASLYEAISGRPPFSGNTPLSILMRVADEDPVSLRKIDASISVKLEAICDKCLQKNPAARYKSAYLLARDLERFCRGERISARTKTATRYRRIVMIAIFTVFFLVGGYWLYQRTNSPKVSLQQRFSRAKAYEKKENYQKALGELDALISEHPNCERAYVYRAKLQHNRDPLLALQDISLAIKIKPRVEYLTLKGSWLQRAGYLEEAYQVLGPLAKSENADRKTIVLTAKISLDLKNYAQAMEYYRRAGVLELLPGERIDFARAALYAGKLQKAKSQLKKVISDEDLSPGLRKDAYYYLGCVFQKLGQEKAINAWEKALPSKVKRSGDIYRAMGKAYYDRGKFNKAFSVLKKAAQAFPDDIQVFSIMGDCCQKSGKLEAAIEAFSRCIDIEPWNGNYYYRRGVLYSERKKYSRAEHDLSAAIRLSPKNFLPVLRMTDLIFEEGLGANSYKLSLLVQSYSYDIELAEEIDLFSGLWQKLSQQCIQNERNQRKQNRQSKWNKSRAKTLLKALMQSQSPSILQLACTALHPMYKQSQIYELIEEESRRTDSGVTKSKLEKLKRELLEKSLGDRKVEFRQLLIRFYRAHDSNAFLQFLHRAEKDDCRCLARMLTDEKENIFIRFLVAQALADTYSPTAYRILKNNMAFGSPVVQLFCRVLLGERYSKGYFITKYRWQTAMDLSSPFARTVAVRYLPEDREILQAFLKDGDIRVRLYAARRLRKFGDPRAEAELVQNFTNDDAKIRAYALAAYWDFSKLKETLPEQDYRIARNRSSRYLPQLINAVDDSDILVRKTAIARLATAGHGKYNEIIAKKLAKGDLSVRLQAIRFLAENLEVELLLPLLLNSEQPLAVRMAVLFSLRHTENNGQKLPNSVYLRTIGLLNDKDPRIRMIFFSILGRQRKGNGRGVLESYAKQHSDDPICRGGYAMGALITPGPDLLPYLRTLLNDRDPMVRELASSAAVFIAYLYSLPELDGIHELLKTRPLNIRKAGAAGYARAVYEKIGIHIRMLQVAPLWSMDEMYRGFIGKMVKQLEAHKDQLNFCLNAFERAIELDPKNARLWVERGIVFRVKGDSDKSIANLKKAIELDENMPIYKVWLARLYFERKKYDKALEVSENCPLPFRFYPKLRNLKGEILRAVGRNEEAALWLGEF